MPSALNLVHRLQSRARRELPGSRVRHRPRTDFTGDGPSSRSDYRPTSRTSTRVGMELRQTST